MDENNDEKKENKGGLIELSPELKEELNTLREENELLKNQLVVKLAIQDAKKKEEKDEEDAETLRRETQGNVGVTFNGNLYGQRVPYKMTVKIKHILDTEKIEISEALKFFERHMKEFAYSRGDCQITIEGLEQILVEEEREKKEVKVEKEQMVKPKKEQSYFARKKRERGLKDENQG